MRKSVFLTAMCLAGAMVGSSASAANLITNPGFDNGLTGYTVTPGDDIQTDQGYKYIYEVSGGTTGTPEAYANYFASFGQHNEENVSSLLTNSFATKAGQNYTLSFDYGQFDEKSGGPQILKFAVAGLTGAVTNPNISIDLSQLFKTYSYSFVGTGSMAQVSFSLVPSGTFRTDGLLDNVSVVTAVPEMSTWAMMFLGLGLAGAAMRRRRSKVAAFA